MAIKFNYIEYSPIKCWSIEKQSFYTANNSASIFWESEGVPHKCEVLSIEECVNRIQKIEVPLKFTAAYTEFKSKRPIMQLVNNDGRLATKELAGYDKWNGCVFVDLDLDKSDILKNVKSEGILDLVYEKLVEVVLYEMNSNFYYIEQSHSGGVHILFYFNVDKTEENFIKCATHVKNMLHKFCPVYIEGFDKVLSEDGVFDPVYLRPYQKIYCTGNKHYINQHCSGSVDFDELDKIEVRKKEKNNSGYYSIAGFNHTNKLYNVDYGQRLKICTAIKAVTSSKEMWLSYWEKMCEQFDLKEHNYFYYVNQFNYSTLRTDAVDISILEKYGFIIDKNKFYIHLNSSEDGNEEWLGDKIEEILNKCQVGINLLIAPTGGGKTRAWIDYNKTQLEDLLGYADKKPVLIVEPLNSIIETKYDKDEVSVVTGSKQFSVSDSSYKMYVTNFNKLLQNVNGEMTARKDLVEFFSQFSLIILDESHTLIKDAYRSTVLIPFAEALKQISNNTKVILQTATPMEETSIFDIKTTITVNKKTDKDIKYIFRVANPDKKFQIQEVTCLCDYYIKYGRKVYVYWNNAGANVLKSFRAAYSNPDRVAIFHKKASKDESMKYITKNHKLGDKYDILLSSVYFGVGNDLDDECDAAVIIIGNNTWQEDIQAIGRWRNAKKIEVCQIILPKEYEEVIESIDKYYNINLLRYDARKIINALYHDKLCRNMSLTIFKKSWQITNPEAIEPLSIMSAAETYHKAISTKLRMFKDPYYGIRVKERYDRPLVCNYEYREKVKEYIAGVKAVRDEFKRNVMLDKYTEEQIYEVINDDTKLEGWYKMWKNFCRLGFDELLKPVDGDLFYEPIPVNYIALSSNTNELELFIKYYKRFIKRECDYAELYSILWYVKQYNLVKDKYVTREAINAYLNQEISIKAKDKDYVITLDEYVRILAYTMFCHFHNNDNQYNYKLFYNHYKSFAYECKLMSNIPIQLINEFFNVRKIDNIPSITEMISSNSHNNSNAYSKAHSISKLRIADINDIKKYFTRYIEEEQDNVILFRCLKTQDKNQRPNNSRPKELIDIEYKGVKYKDVNEAVEKTGKTPQAIRKWIREHKK